MYRFPDPLDEAALKGLIADKRFQDPRHPEHEFFKKFVAKAFDLVHPDVSRDGAGNAVVDPREPSEPRVVRGGDEFVPDGPDSALGVFKPVGKDRDEATSPLRDAPAPEAKPVKRETPIGSITSTPMLRAEDPMGKGYFGAPRKSGPHNGSDIRAVPKDDIQSPVDGIVLAPQLDPYGNNGDPRLRGKLNGVQILDDEGRIIQLLYVRGTSKLKKGTRIKRGDVIGSAEDVAGEYAAIDKPGMKNHVHVEVWQPNDANYRPDRSLLKKELKERYTPRNAWQLMQVEGGRD